jgi:uncharacterized protein YegL
MGQMAQSTGDYFALLGRDDEAKGEYLAAIAAYDQVISSFSNFTEIQSNKQKLLKKIKNIGDLQEKLQGRISEFKQIGHQVIVDIYDEFTRNFEPQSQLLFSANPKPRFPVVLLLDTSGSMSGEPINALNRGLAIFKETLEQDEIASMRVDVAIITFGKTHFLQDFVTVDQLILPHLVAAGTTPMGEAIELALDLLESRKRTYKENGILHYKPWIFLVTDGEPTDSWQNAAQRVRDGEMNNKFNFFAVGLLSANMDILKDISPHNTPPMFLNQLDFTSMFKWVTASLKQVSTSRMGGEVKLPPVAWGKVAI